MRTYGHIWTMRTSLLTGQLVFSFTTSFMFYRMEEDSEPEALLRAKRLPNVYVRFCEKNQPLMKKKFPLASPQEIMSKLR